MIFSASRIKTFLSCPRKFAWQYLAGLPSPTSKAQSFGQDVHAILEQFVSQGYPVDVSTPEGLVAAQGAPYVLEYVKDPGVTCEREFQFASSAGRYWRGFKDLETPELILDYKTTASVQYALTPDALMYDAQAILYAHEHFLTYEGDTVRLVWLYLQKRKPIMHLPVIVDMTRDHAALGFRALEESAAAAESLTGTTAEDILTIEGNYSACGEYGGCPYRAQCGRLFS